MRKLPTRRRRAPDLQRRGSPPSFPAHTHGRKDGVRRTDPEPDEMKFALAAALLITLPAVVALAIMAFSDNKVIAIAAAASVGLNTLPFVIAGFFLRGKRGADMGH